MQNSRMKGGGRHSLSEVKALSQYFLERISIVRREDASRLGYYSVATGKGLPMCWRLLVHSSSVWSSLSRPESSAAAPQEPQTSYSETSSWSNPVWSGHLPHVFIVNGHSKLSSKVPPRTGHEGPEGSRGIALRFPLTSALDGGGWLKPRPGRCTHGKETRYSLYRRLDGPQGRSRQVRKISPRRGFDPRTLQPAASLYTDWAIPAQTFR